MYYLSMHGSRLRFKDLILRSRFKGYAGLVITDPQSSHVAPRKCLVSTATPRYTTSAGGQNHVTRVNISYHLYGRMSFVKSQRPAPTALWDPLDGTRLRDGNSDVKTPLLPCSLPFGKGYGTSSRKKGAAADAIGRLFTS